MNIFFLIHKWILGGVQTFIENLIVGLEKYEDIKIHLLYIPEFGYEIDENNIPKKLKKHLKIFDVPINISFEKRMEILKNHILQFDNNIVISDSHYTFSYLSTYKQINMIGIIHTHDAYYYYLINNYKPYFSSVVSVSKLIKKTIDNSYPKTNTKSYLINYGIDTKKFNNKIKNIQKNKIDIIYSGRLEQYHKRVLDIIKIIKKLEKSEIEYNFHIIGDGSYKSILQKELSNNKNVIFYGHLSLDEVVDIYKKMDILVMTSEFEGMPLVLLENMSVGVVPIVSDFKSGTEVLNEKNSLMVDIGDIDGFLEGIQRLYFDRDLLYSMKMEAQKTIHKNYSISKMTQKYYKLFKEILSSKKEDIDKNYYESILIPQKSALIDEFIKREKLILKNTPNIAIYGYGKAGKMVEKLLNSLNKTPKYIIDDSLLSNKSVTFKKFLTLQKEIDLIVMGKYQNIYHNLDKIKTDILRLESIK